MIFLRSQILGFGKLKGSSLEFKSGLNLVFAPNEGGKSTLQRFLAGMLYGQLRSDLKVQRRLDPWVELFKPWHGSEYGGVLWCRLDDEREVEIHRFFGKDETRIEIRASTGEDITSQYEQQRNGEVLFARFHFGMPKELFESVGMIRENKVAEIHGYETIRDRIANLAQSGDEELSIRQSLAHIREKMEYIGSDRAPTKPYKQAQDLVQSLQAERTAADERRSQFRNWIEDRNNLAGEISGLERTLSRAQMALLSARRREASARVQSLEEIENDRCSLAAEIESLRARADFPADGLEELNQLVGACDSIAKHLSEVRTEKEAALAQQARAESERQGLAVYESFAASAEAEKITEWFVSHLSISLQRDGLVKTLNRLKDEAGALEKRLNERSPALSDPANDWQRLALEAVEEEQSASRNCDSLAEKTAREKANIESAKRTARNRRMFAVAMLILALAPTAVRLLAGLNQLPLLFDIGFGAACAIFSIFLLWSASKSSKAERNARQVVHEFEAEMNVIKESGGKKRKQLNDAMAVSGFHKLDDFLSAARQCDQDRQKLADLRARHDEAEQQRERLQAQSAETYQLLKDALARVGLACSPGNLKFQIDIMRNNLRRFRELDAGYKKCVQDAESLKSKELLLTGEYDEKRTRLQSLLDQADVDTPEKFREECSKRQKLLELTEKAASRDREFRRLAGEQTLAQWKEQLQTLMDQAEPQHPGEDAVIDERAASDEGSAPFLPYLPTIAEAEEREKQIASRLSGTREEYARALERINQAFQSVRPSFEIDEDLAIAERTFMELDRNRVALGIALDTLEKLSRQQQEVLAPQLNAAVEQRFLRLCRNRYEEVKVDPDFQVWVREIETGQLRSAEHLSRGTQDQLYFAMRFGILDLVSNEGEPCPCLLDEPFAAYDQTRLAEAFGVLKVEAERRQLILFTCREDLLDLAQRHSANIIRI
jgi:uncharacterized protein YhaN